MSARWYSTLRGVKVLRATLRGETLATIEHRGTMTYVWRLPNGRCDIVPSQYAAMRKVRRALREQLSTTEEQE